MASKDDKLQMWKREAIKTQDYYFNVFGGRIWDEFNSGEQQDEIYQTVIHALFGPPKNESDEGYQTVTKRVFGVHTSDMGYSKHQRKCARNIIEQICKHNFDKTKIHMAVIFVCVYHGENSGCVPMFRVRKSSKCRYRDNVFIDHTQRVYDDLDHYLKDNIHDQSTLCLPADGYYSMGQNYIFVDQMTRGSVLRGFDIASTVSTVGTTLTMVVGGAMCLFPPTVPVGSAIVFGSMCASAPGVAFGFGRSVQKLVDRGMHKQSIGLADSEARNCWINSVGSVLAIGSIGVGKVIASAATTGRSISTSAKIFCNTLGVVQLGCTGAGVASGIADLVLEERKPTPLEALQISTSLLLLTHSVFSFKCVGTIIEDAQNKSIVNINNGVGKRDQAKLSRILNGIIERQGSTAGKQEFIRTFQKIDNVPAFLSHYKLTPGGLEQTKQFPMSSNFNTMTNLEKTSYQTIVENIQNGASPQTKLVKMYATPVMEEVNRNNAMTTGLKIGGKSVTNLSPYLTDILEKILKYCVNELRQLVVDMVSKIRSESMIQFNRHFRAFCEWLEKQILELRVANPNPERRPGVNVIQHYANQIKQNIENEDSVEYVKNIVSEGQDHLDDPFLCNEIIPELNNLPVEMYPEIIDELAGCKITEKLWVQTDNNLKCFFHFKSRDQEVTFINVNHDSAFVYNETTGKAKLYVC